MSLRKSPRRMRELGMDEYTRTSPACHLPVTFDTEHLSTLSGKELLIEQGPTPYLVDRLYPRASVNLLLATSNVGKTMISCAAMLAVASGKPLMGQFATRKGSALLLDWESRAGFIQNRLLQMSRGMGVSEEEMASVHVKTPVPYNVSDPCFWDYMGAMCEGKDLVILDSLGAMTPGLDENDKNMRVALDQLRHVNDYTTFLVIHHTRKLPLGHEVRDGEELGRGSGAIKQAVDLEYTFIRNAHGVIRTYQTKNRIGGRMEAPFDWTIRSDWDGHHSTWLRLECVS